MISTNTNPAVETNGPVPYRPLGLIKQLLEALNLDITYMYEDLIFVEHNAFLLQMGEKGEDLHVWFNSESLLDDRPEILWTIEQHAAQLSLKAAARGVYALQQHEEHETFQLELISQSS